VLGGPTTKVAVGLVISEGQDSHFHKMPDYLNPRAADIRMLLSGCVCQDGNNFTQGFSFTTKTVDESSSFVEIYRLSTRDGINTSP
jgi:hypothetical protein